MRLGCWETGRLGNCEAVRRRGWENGRLGGWESRGWEAGRLGDWWTGRLGVRDAKETGTLGEWKAWRLGGCEIGRLVSFAHKHTVSLAQFH